MSVRLCDYEVITDVVLVNYLPEAAAIIRNIVRAIDHLHSMNIAHRDLKVRTDILAALA